MTSAAAGESARVLPNAGPWSLRHPQTKEFLWWCAPALLLGLILRAVITWQMPYGYMQFDSADFLFTAATFFERHHVSIHSKRTFLVPLLYTIPFILHLPALIFIPIAQHLSGLGVVLMSGALVRLWLAPWRWVILPVTLLIAANPVLLWYEHALMSESAYLFFVFALALAGTLYTQQPTRRHFILVLVALFFTAAARPEGRLLLGFGFPLLVFVQWGQWKVLWPRLAWLTGVVIVTLIVTTTHQAGQLLYATVISLAPDESKVDPEFGRMVLPLRDEVRSLYGGVPKKLQGLEKRLSDMSDVYLKSKGEKDPDGNSLCQKMAIEACLNHPGALPGLAARKFLLAVKFPASVGYDEPRLSKKLNIGFNRKGQLDTLSKGLVGQELKDTAAVADFVREHYHPMLWYRSIDRAWEWFTVGSFDDDEDAFIPTIPPVPIFYRCALVALAIVLVMPGPFQKFHFAWIVSLAVLWFAVAMTGVNNPRYRYVFEPFCLIYLFVAVVLVGQQIARWFGKRAGQTRGDAETSGHELSPSDHLSKPSFAPSPSL
ncbi:MAG: hypothetical protein P4L99_10570 [Chthoniobacter sp.]|nr:hypothetical protein [Chthoniobacter sp.]